MFYRTAFCDLLRLFICHKASGWKLFLKMKYLGIGWKFEVKHPPINLQKSETSWKKSSCPSPTSIKPTPNIHVFSRSPALYSLVELSFMLVVTQPLVRPRPLKLPSVIQFLRHQETLYSRLHSTSCRQLFPLRVFSTTAEVAIIEFSANTTVSSVRGIFLKY